jgi:glutaredoxin
VAISAQWSFAFLLRDIMTNAIKIYTVSTCNHCKAAKEFFDNYGVTYDCKEIDTASEKDQPALMEEVKKFNPACTVPTIIVGDKIIVGFKEKLLREILADVIHE